MDRQEMLRLKTVLESDINALMSQFSETTGLVVKHVEVNNIHAISDNPGYVINVEAGV